jgi:hypothetical protein
LIVVLGVFAAFFVNFLESQRREQARYDGFLVNGTAVMKNNSLASTIYCRIDGVAF